MAATRKAAAEKKTAAEKKVDEVKKEAAEETKAVEENVVDETNIIEEKSVDKMDVEESPVNKVEEVVITFGPMKISDMGNLKLHELLRLVGPFSISYDKSESKETGKREHTGYLNMPVLLKRNMHLITISKRIEKVKSGLNRIDVVIPENFTVAVKEAIVREADLEKKNVEKQAELIKEQATEREEKDKKQKSVKVENLPDSATEEAIKALFPECVSVTIVQPSEGDENGKRHAIALFKTKLAANNCARRKTSKLDDQVLSLSIVMPIDLVDSKSKPRTPRSTTKSESSTRSVTPEKTTTRAGPVLSTRGRRFNEKGSVTSIRGRGGMSTRGRVMNDRRDTMLRRATAMRNVGFNPVEEGTVNPIMMRKMMEMNQMQQMNKMQQMMMVGNRRRRIDHDMEMQDEMTPRITPQAFRAERAADDGEVSYLKSQLAQMKKKISSMEKSKSDVGYGSSARDMGSGFGGSSRGQTEYGFSEFSTPGTIKDYQGVSSYYPDTDNAMTMNTAYEQATPGYRSGYVQQQKQASNTGYGRSSGGNAGRFGTNTAVGGSTGRFAAKSDYTGRTTRGNPRGQQQQGRQTGRQTGKFSQRGGSAGRNGGGAAGDRYSNWYEYEEEDNGGPMNWSDWKA